MKILEAIKKLQELEASLDTIAPSDFSPDVYSTLRGFYSGFNAAIANIEWPLNKKVAIDTKPCHLSIHKIAIDEGFNFCPKCGMALSQ